MSGPPRIRSKMIADKESRSVLGPAGNKARPNDIAKQASKPLKKVEMQSEKKFVVTPSTPAIQKLERRFSHQTLLNSSMNASCSSDASSSDSSSRSSRTAKHGVVTLARRKQCSAKVEKVKKVEFESVSVEKIGNDVKDLDSFGCSGIKTRCAWITPISDQCHVAFHDEEWGVPVHDDKRLFELLCLSSALAELTWPAILNKRNIFREVFLDFDTIAISKLNEKRFIAPGSPASTLLSELRLRAMLENARQTCKVIEEFGSFEKYVWSFVNRKPIVSQLRYPRQVPVKTPKAEVISKDLVRKGFRCVGPTVVHTFMQVAGLTNDHFTSCFRFKECLITPEGKEKDGIDDSKNEEKPTRAMAELRFTTK